MAILSWFERQKVRWRRQSSFPGTRAITAAVAEVVVEGDAAVVGAGADSNDHTMTTVVMVANGPITDTFSLPKTKTDKSSERFTFLIQFSNVVDNV